VSKQSGTWLCENAHETTEECLFETYHCFSGCDEASAARMQSFLRRFDGMSSLEVCPTSLAHALNG
jgi:hypothetical protein